MDVEEEEADASKQEEEPIMAPFPVATVKEGLLNLRAYLNTQGRAEWLWARVQAFLGIGGYGGTFLASNKAALMEDMELCEIPQEQLHYKPKGYQGSLEEPWKDHTLESRCLLSLSLTCLKCKPLKLEQKEKALQLFLSLTSFAFHNAAKAGQLPPWPHVCMYAPNGSPAMGYLIFTKHGLCESWNELVEKVPAAQALWGKLSQVDWRGHRLSSPLTHAKIQDIAAFLLHLATNPKLKMNRQIVWEVAGRSVLPNLIFFIGECLEVYAKALSQEPLQELPPLKTKQGFARKSSDHINKFMVLDRVRKERLHRWRVAKTHSNLISEHFQMMKKEAYLASVLHDAATNKAFHGLKQLAVHWDPSTYGGKETFVGMIYSADLDLASYLLVQPLRKLLVSDLDDSLKSDGRKGKLKRIEGYVEVRGLSAALANLGISLSDFAVPPDVHWKPLGPNQLRVQIDGVWHIADEKEGTLKPQIPPQLKLGQLPLLVSVSDQGPNNMAALSFLQYSESAILVACFYDVYHRAWNDLKLAARRATAFPWRTMLEMTVVFNLPYGPFGSGTWYGLKQDCLTNFISEHSSMSSTFQSYLPLICREMGIQEPQTSIEQDEFFQRLELLSSFSTKGPLVKLMRWFSWFESAMFYRGELWATKMILLGSGDNAAGEEEAPEPVNAKALAAKDARSELAALKKSMALGSWHLC